MSMMTTRMRMMTMWTKYDYLCTDCDALIEITTLKDLTDYRGWCSCGSPNLVNVGSSDATVYGSNGESIPVTNITPSRLVKINSNPYN